MIRAEELRIWNWIQTPRGKKSINGLGFKDTVVSSKDYYATFNELHEGYFLEHCEPIKLSEEILLKCGFEKDKEGWFCKNWGTNGVVIIVWMPHYKKFGMQLGQGYTKVLDYLHQLQNGYKFHTNEELTVYL